MRRRRRARAWCAALALLLASAAPRALAQEAEPPPKPFAVLIQGDLYITNVNLRRIFTAALREKLGSGLTTQIVIRTQVVDLDSGDVKARGISGYSVRYRLFEEDYHVRHWGPYGERSFRLKRYEDVMRRVARQRALPLATRGALAQGGRYQAVVEVDVDPVSKELLQKVREYLSNPGGHRAEGGSRGLFGNLARIFFDPQANATTTVLELRSSPFGGLPPLPPTPPAPPPIERP